MAYASGNAFFRFLMVSFLIAALASSVAAAQTPPAPPTQNCESVVNAAPPTVSAAANMDTGQNDISLGSIVTVVGEGMEKLLTRPAPAGGGTFSQ